MLTADQAVAQANKLHEYHLAERTQLDRIRRYWHGRQKSPALVPESVPREVKTMLRVARVNVCRIVVDSLAQSLFVSGFRAKNDEDENATWAVWQANRMDARQSGIHRAAAAYGAAYAVVLPGEPLPVIRGVSPRRLIAMYGDDPDWPVYALERRDQQSWRLYDNQAIYTLQRSRQDSKFTFQSSSAHGMPVTPVVRYLDEEDLDCDDDIPGEQWFGGWEDMPMRGQIAPLMQIQDQIDLTTFGLLTAQHFGAFRQRYILGWAAENEKAALKAAASQIWTFDVDAKEVKVGEFDQTDLTGYIDSREASLRHAATLSQTPVHELIGELVNLSADALAAAEAGHDRKVDERKTMLGESHEQTMWLVGQLIDVEVPDDAEVVWRDTSSRSLSQTVDALGKLVTMLGVPPQEMWAKIPGVTQQDVERWKEEAQTGDAFQQLSALLERQNAPVAQPEAA